MYPSLHQTQNTPQKPPANQFKTPHPPFIGLSGTRRLASSTPSNTRIDVYRPRRRQFDVGRSRNLTLLGDDPQIVSPRR